MQTDCIFVSSSFMASPLKEGVAGRENLGDFKDLVGGTKEKRIPKL